MKKIFMLLVACVAMMFVSCSDDDDDVTKGANGEKLVSTLKYSEEITNSNLSYIERYEYDKQGRITKRENTETYEDETGTYICLYTYKDNKIILNDDGDEMIYTLNDKGLVIKSSDPEYGESEYAYNEQNQLIKITGSVQATFVWENGNIISEKIKHNWDSGFTDYKYEYNSNENKTAIIRLYAYDTAIDDALCAAGYFGAKTKNLATKRIKATDTYKTIRNYTLDKEGYVIATNGTTEGKQESITIEYK